MYSLHLFFAKALGLARLMDRLSVLGGGKTLHLNGIYVGVFRCALLIATSGQAVQTNPLSVIVILCHDFSM